MVLVDADWWLYLVLVIAIFVLLAVNVYVLVLWQHPDDKNEAYWPKFVVLLGLTVAEGSVLFLPLDVANNSGSIECGQSWSDIFCGSLNMEVAWDVIFIMMFVLALFVIPYTIFFYEEDDTAVLQGTFDFRSTCVRASSYMLGVVVIVALVLGLMYTLLGYTDIPVQEYALATADLLAAANTGTVTNADTGGIVIDTSAQTAGVTSSEEKVHLQVQFPLYVLGLMAFVGWFLFVAFGGLGMGGIPIDSIRAYLNRPQKLDRGQIAALEVSIQRRCNELLDIGGLFQQARESGKRSAAHDGFIARRRRERQEKQEFNNFKQMVILLEEDYEQMKLCKDYAKSYNPLKPLFWLFFGVVTAIIALMWILQIVLFMLIEPPVTPFLNDYFQWFDNWFPLFGVLSVAIFCFYLMAAVIKGCFKFGLRLVWFTLHPMKMNETYMNSFLFNVGIILMCAPAVLQFSVQAFSIYAANATINQLINVQVQYLQFFRIFYANNVFVYAFLAFTVLGTIYLSLKPTDASVSAKKVRDALRSLETNVRMQAPVVSSPSASTRGKGNGEQI